METTTIATLTEFRRRAPILSSSRRRRLRTDHFRPLWPPVTRGPPGGCTAFGRSAVWRILDVVTRPRHIHRV